MTTVEPPAELNLDAIRERALDAEHAPVGPGALGILANSAEDVPDLIAEVKALRHERARLRQELDEARAERDRMVAELAVVERQWRGAVGERDRMRAVVDAAEKTLTDAQAAADAAYAETIDVAPEASVREGWHRASCSECTWTTTGLESVVEEAGREHVGEVHPYLAHLASAAIHMATFVLRLAVDAYRSATPDAEPAPGVPVDTEATP